MFASMRNDIRVIKQRDPAVKNTLEVVLCYSGLHAIWAYRLSHFFYKKSWFVTARFISTLARLATGIEIHPGAQIGEGCSSTTVRHRHRRNHHHRQQCFPVPGSDPGRHRQGKRQTASHHRRLCGGGLRSQGAGSFTVGEGAKIGAGSVVLKEVPPYATVVGIPGHVVARKGIRVAPAHSERDVDLNHNRLPDPIEDQIAPWKNRCPAETAGQ